MQIVNTHFEGGLFALFLDGCVDFLLCFFHHLFDSGRMNTAVHNELFQCNSGDFSSDRIEAGKNHCLRCVINDQIHAGQGFNGADVSSFTSDDSSLHFIVRQVHHRYGGFCHVVGSASLNGAGDDVLGLLVCFFLGFGFNFLDHDGSFMTDFLLRVCQENGLGLFYGVTGDPLQFFHLFRQETVQFFVLID